MHTLVYWLIFPFLWLISILPWKLFYLFSDIICFIVYRVFKYRKKVVTTNLYNAFPEKTDHEIKKIRGKFYSHMCDMFLEMVKSISISDASTKKHFKFINTESLRKLENSGKSYILLAGHYASYEWGNCIDLSTSFKSVGVYKPIRNLSFDKLAKKIRGRFGAEIVPNNKIVRYAISKERKKSGGSIYGLVADQTPKLADNNYWLNFMNQEVPVFVGGEVLAKKLDLNIAYLKVDKIRRGYYEAEVVIISENIKSVPDFKATEKYIQLLEDQIKKRPELYLWTHKRWKHAR